MFRGGYGILKLPPSVLYRLTPGEYADMMTARAWVNQQRQGPQPLVGAARAQELAKFDALMGARGQPR